MLLEVIVELSVTQWLSGKSWDLFRFSSRGVTIFREILGGTRYWFMTMYV